MPYWADWQNVPTLQIIKGIRVYWVEGCRVSLQGFLEGVLYMVSSISGLRIGVPGLGLPTPDFMHPSRLRVES